MAKAQIKIEFPCGYKYELNMEGLGLEAHTKEDEMPICPIHKEKCKREIR